MFIPRRTFLAKAWAMTWVSAIGVLLPSSPVKAQTSTNPKHLEDALLLLKGLLLENNNYQHGTPNVTWKGVKGAPDYVSKTDCSGFMSKLLQHSYGDYFTKERFEQWMKKKRDRPLAEDFYNAIVKQKDFIQIKKLAQVQAGDIIAIKYIPDEDPKTKDNTGHVMLVVEPPKKRDSTKPLVKKTFQWEVMVIDQSCSGHGQDDSRRKPDSSDDDSQPDGDGIADNERNNPCEPNKRFNDGLGKGIMRIYTNKDNDNILGYTWSISQISDYYSPEERDLVIGRLDLKV
jgi:hypothetical protein